MTDLDAFLIFPDRDQPYIVLADTLPPGALDLTIRQATGSSFAIVTLDERPWARIAVGDDDAGEMLCHAGAKVVHGIGTAAKGSVRHAIVTEEKAP